MSVNVFTVTTKKFRLIDDSVSRVTGRPLSPDEVARALGKVKVVCEYGSDEELRDKENFSQTAVSVSVPVSGCHPVGDGHSDPCRTVLVRVPVGLGRLCSPSTV